MPTNLSIKNVPTVLAERLRARAERRHRSLQGELMAILEEAVYGSDRMSPREVLAEVRRLRLRTGDESTRIVRSDRNAR